MDKQQTLFNHFLFSLIALVFGILTLHYYFSIGQDPCIEQLINCPKYSMCDCASFYPYMPLFALLSLGYFIFVYLMLLTYTMESLRSKK